MKTKGHNVLVVGDDGFVGACLVKGLEETGANVITPSPVGNLLEFINGNTIEKIYFVHFGVKEVPIL